MPFSLPLSTVTRNHCTTDLDGPGGRSLAVLGAAGVVGTITRAALAGRYEITGLDTAQTGPGGESPWWSLGSITDRQAVLRTLTGCDYALLTATGAKAGWDGLKTVEIEGTRIVCEAAAEARLRRLVVVSSNHVTGMTEVDRWEGLPTAASSPQDPVRPDGLYASCKAFVEAVARTTSEVSGLRVSVLRLGAMRLLDDPDRAEDGPHPPGQGDADYRRRMRSVWMPHDLWAKVLMEELMSTETFRLRYASRSDAGTPWTPQVLAWNYP